MTLRFHLDDYLSLIERQPEYIFRGDRHVESVEALVAAEKLVAHCGVVDRVDRLLEVTEAYWGKSEGQSGALYIYFS